MNDAMNHCLDEDLALHAGGDLAPEEAARVEAHVARCPACRERLAGLRESGAAFALLAGDEEDEAAGPAVTAEAAALERVRTGVRAGVARIEAEREGAGSRPPRWALAAALLLALLAATVWPRPGTRPDPGPASDGETPAEGATTHARRAPAPDRSANDEARSRPVIEPVQPSSPPPPPSRSSRPAPRAPERTAEIEIARADIEDVGQATPPNMDPASTPTSSAAEPRITIRVVSDDPDIVFYWLVDEPEENRDEDVSS